MIFMCLPILIKIVSGQILEFNTKLKLISKFDPYIIQQLNYSQMMFKLYNFTHWLKSNFQTFKI